MTTPSVSYETGFDEAVEKINSYLEKIRRKIDEIFDDLNRVIRWMPDPLVEPLKRGVDVVIGLIEKFNEQVAHILNWLGSPPILKDAGSRWVSGVGTPAAHIAREMKASHMKVDDYWEGDAASAYKDVVNEQGKAFNALAQLVGKLDGILGDVANAITQFVLSMAAALLTLVISVVAAAVEAATVAGAPLVPPTLIAGISGTIVLLISAGQALYTLMVSNADAVGDLRNAQELSTAFDGDNSEKWPKATVDTNEFRPD